MNKKCFRIIFSKTLQRLIVTSELARTADKSGKQSHNDVVSLSCQVIIRPLVFSLFCALGFVTFSSSALAETLIIKADPNASKQERPIVLQTASGIPQVNIQTPNAKGLSHNKYSKFDVDAKGVILNNSRTDVVTQQAGWVQGNPHLARGEAKVILNEVNSPDPSVLKGYVEVAGKKAEVIIANPSGLHCDGCGVINADRVTMTTGKPQINQGNLEAFVVEKGKVSVAGKGMDNSRVDYTEIIAREKQVNAGIWSKKAVNVVVGKNTVKRSAPEDGLQIIHQQQADTTEAKPQFAIDVGELGGMYAGKVHLIGTEHGVGVRNAGHIGADSDSVKIDANGKLYNSGTINAVQSVDITTEAGIVNNGRIESKQSGVNLHTKAGLQQDGTVIARAGQIKATAQHITQKGETVARDDVDYQAGFVQTSPDSLIGAGINFTETQQGVNRTPQSPHAQGKNIRIKANHYALMQGHQIASGKVDIEAGETNLTRARIDAYDVDAKSTSADLNAHRAQIRAKNHLSFNTPSLLSLQYSHLEAQRILPQFARLDTTRTHWKQLSDDDFVINSPDGFVNQGIFDIGGHIRVNAAFLDNTNGGLIAGKSLIANTSQGEIRNRNGILSAKQQLSLKTDRLDNTQGYIYGHNVDLTVQGEIINQHTRGDTKGIASIGELSIQSGYIDNQSGQIQSLKGLTLSSADVVNHNGIIHTKQQATLALNGSYQASSGRLDAKDMTVVAQDFRQTDNASVNVSNLQLNLSGQLDNRNSHILSQNHISVSALQVDNRQGEMAAQGTLNIDTKAQSLLTEGGKLLGQQGVVLQTGDLDNKGGQIGGLNIKIVANALENSQGVIAGKQQLNLQLKGDYQATKGRIEAGDAEILANAFKQTAESAVVSGGVLHIGTQEALTNTNSVIVSTDDLNVTAKQINSHHGKIISEQGRLTIDAQAHELKADYGQLKGRLGVLLKSGKLDNRAGQIESEGNITVTSAVLDNTSGSILSRQYLNINSDALNNNQGRIQADQQLTLNTHGQDVDNTAGKIIAGSDLTFKGGSLNNDEGFLYSGQKMHLDTNGQILTNRQTRRLSDNESRGILAKAALTIRSGELDNRSGRIESGGALSVQSQSVNNDNALLLSRLDADIQSLAFSNQNGEVRASEGRLTLDTKGNAVDNRQGRIDALHNLTLSSGKLDNTGGLLRSEADIALDTRQQSLVNTQTLNEQSSVGIVAGKALHVRSGDIDNRQGLIKAGLQATVNGQQLTNDQGLISAQAGDFRLSGVTQQQGAVKFTEDLTLHVTQDALSTDKSQISAKNIRANIGGKLSNQQSEILAENDLSVQSGELDNRQGLLTAQQGQLSLNTQNEQLDNTQGTISARTRLQIDSGKLDNTQGLIQSQGSSQINTAGQVLVNRDTLQQSVGQALSSGIIALEQLTLNVGAIDNQQGNIYSRGDQQIQSGDLDNRQGQVVSQGHQILQSGHIQNSQGILSAKGNAQLAASSLNGDKSVVKADKLDLNIQSIQQTQAVIQAKSDLTMRGDTLSSTTGSQITGAQVTVEMQGQIDNSQSHIQAVRDLALSGKGLINHQGSINTIEGKIQLDTQQQQLNNQDGEIDAATALSIQSGLLNNTRGKLESRAGTDINTHGQALINAETLSDDAFKGIYSKGKVNINAGELNNQSGRIFSEKELITRVERDVNNVGGGMDSVGRQELSAGSIDNRTGQIGSQDQLAVSASSVINENGDILSQNGISLQVSGNVNNIDGTIATQTQNVFVKSADLNNQRGMIQSTEGDLTLQAGGVFNNALGKLLGQGNAVVTAQSVNNVQGTISVSKALNLHSQGEIDNRQGHITANADSQIKSSAFHNQQGLVSILEGNLSLEGSTQINNQAEGQYGSTISAAKRLTLTTNALNNQNTKGTTAETEKNPIQGILGGDIQLNARALNNENGGIYSQGELQMGGVKQLINRGGILYSAKKQQVDTDEPTQPIDIDNQDGVIEAGGVTLRKVRFGGSNYGTIKSHATSEIETEGDLTIGNDDKWYFDSLSLSVGGKFANEGRLDTETALNIKAKEIVNGLYKIMRVGVKGQMVLNADNISNQGLISGGYNFISATGNIDNKGTLLSRLLRLNSQKLTNAGVIDSSEAYIESPLVENTGQIIRSGANDSGQTLIQIKANTITNRGEINADFTHILATKLSNIGSGKIYGKHLGIGAQQLENLAERTASNEFKSGTIGATERLDLGVKRLLNKDKSVIYSLGDMALGGQLNSFFEAEGKADLVDNSSATFDIQGNAWVNSAHFINQDIHVRPGTPLVKRENMKLYARFIEGVQVSDWLRDGVDGRYYRNNRSNYETWFDRHTGRDVFSQAGVNDVWRERDITRTTTETQFVNMDPAQFIVGGSLSLNGDRLHNKYSRLIIGKTLYLNNLTYQSNPDHKNLPAGRQELINEDLIKQRIVQDTGQQIDYIREEGNCDVGGYVGCLLRKEAGRTTIYDSPQIEKIPLHMVKNEIGGSVTNGNHTIDMPPPTTIEQTTFEHFNITTQGNLKSISGVQASVRHGWGISLQQNERLPNQNGNGKDSVYLQLQPKVADDGVPVRSGAVNSLLEATIYRDALLSPEGLDKALYQQLYRVLFGADGKNTLINSQRLGQLRLPQVRTRLTDIRLPQDSRFKLNPNAQSPYWYGQDNLPGHRDWLGSDYLQNQLRNNGEWRLKRLGDGYYEQQLIKEQIVGLTGRRFIQGFESDDAQYRALMNNAIDYAKAFNLRPGVGLTASQMSRLTRDMVWMVEREVTINGQSQKVLVPQVYLVSRHTDVGGEGAIISANKIEGKIDGAITNSGRISGVVSTDLKANILTNRYGTIEGGTVDLHTTEKLQNLGGRIRAGSRLKATSDGEIDLGSTTSEGSLAELKGEGEYRNGKRLFATRTEDSKRQLALVDSLSELTVTDLQGQLEVNAKGNLNAAGAQIHSAGSAKLHSDKQVNLGTVKQKDHLESNKDNYRRIDSELDTEISAVNGVLVSGNKGIEARGGFAHSEKGDVVFYSDDGEINLDEAREVSEIATHSRTKKKKAGGLSKKVTEKRTYDYDEET